MDCGVSQEPSKKALCSCLRLAKAVLVCTLVAAECGWGPWGGQVSKVDPSMPQDEAKALLIQKLETFVQEKIIFAGDVLVSIAATKVEDGDVILTYGFSTTVYGLILRAALKVRSPCLNVVLAAKGCWPCSGV